MGLDLGDGQVALAQVDDLALQVAEGSRRLAARRATGPKEEVGRLSQLAEVAGDGIDGGHGAAEAIRDLLGGHSFVVEGPQDFVAALAAVGRVGKEVGGIGRGHCRRLTGPDHE
ncbi:MAG: hypothetical protein OXN89_11865 [Bryobacterales bacterium]|nr:hypothetical protein [Bryobacterales bacterium]